jgi:hypothetical protein
VKALLWIAAIVLFIGCYYLQAAWEAEAFNRVTGKHVSVMDAIFLDLRVQATPTDSVGVK